MQKKYKNVWKDQRTGLWRYKINFKKKKYYGNGFPTEKQAGLAAEERKSRLMSEFKRTLTVGTTFLDVSSKLLDSLRIAEFKIGKDVIDNKEKAIGDFLIFLNNMNIELNAITESNIEDYLETRPNNDSFNRYRTSLSQVFKYAIYPLKITTYNPVELVPKRRVRDRRERLVPTYTELMKILSVAKDQFPGPKSKSRYKDIRCDERDLLQIIILTVARYGEILHLKWEDVDLENKILTKHTYKTEDQSKKKILVPINNDLFLILHRRWKERQQDEWVFWNHLTSKPYDRRPKLMRKLCKLANVRNIEFHGIRHFVITQLRNDNRLPDVAAKDLAGHQKMETTDKYTHPVTETHWAAVKTLENLFDPNIIDADYKVIERTRLLPQQKTTFTEQKFAKLLKQLVQAEIKKQAENNPKSVSNFCE